MTARLVSTGFMVALAVLARPAAVSSVSIWSAIPQQDAATVLVAARAALGGEDRVGRVGRIEFEADAQLITAGQVMSNDVVQFEFVLPHRYIRRSERSWPPATERQGFDGQQFINEIRSRDAAISTGIQPPSKEDLPRLLRWVREMATAYLVAVLLTERTPLPVDYRSAGRAVSPEGEADVLEAWTADGYVVRVFLDGKSHRPLMAQYSQGIETKTHSAMTLYLADYRRVDGVWFAHEWRITRDGQPHQVLRIKRVRVFDR